MMGYYTDKMSLNQKFEKQEIWFPMRYQRLKSAAFVYFFSVKQRGFGLQFTWYVQEPVQLWAGAPEQWFRTEYRQL